MKVYTFIRTFTVVDWVIVIAFAVVMWMML